MKDAFAASGSDWQVGRFSNNAFPYHIFSNNGKKICSVSIDKVITKYGVWLDTGC